MIKPNYYQLNNDNDDLFSFFEKGLLTADEVRGFYKGDVFKYLTRYRDKNGVKDLEKAQTYLDQLIKFEQKREEYKTEQKFLKSAADFGEPFKHKDTALDIGKNIDEYYKNKKALKQNNGSGIKFYE